MKIIVELKDEDAEWLKKTLRVDVTKLANSIITLLIEAFKEFELTNRAKIPMTEENIREFADEIGRKAFREAKLEDETP